MDKLIINPTCQLYTTGIQWQMADLCSFSERFCVLFIALAFFL